MASIKELGGKGRKREGRKLSAASETQLGTSLLNSKMYISNLKLPPPLLLLALQSPYFPPIQRSTGEQGSWAAMESMFSRAAAMHLWKGSAMLNVENSPIS